jgi:long-chain acyl-CoA synthetase
LGGTIVLVDSVSPKAIAKAISENGVTCFMAAASIYETLVRHYESSPFDASSMRIPESGGMHTSMTLAQKVAEYFKAPMVPVWGSTEATGIALATPVDFGYRPRSMGKPCPYYEVKVIGDNGEELPPGEIGEMAIKGPGVCAGYYNNPFETAKCMKDGWFFTGDLVSRDSEDYFYFADRRARMMKVAGMKVYPTEIEEVLKSHPDIAEAVVVKVDDRLHGEIPKAIIVAEDGSRLDKNEIRRYCEDRVAKYKTPRVIEFQSELPKTPGGKILWRQLME